MAAWVINTAIEVGWPCPTVTLQWHLLGGREHLMIDPIPGGLMPTDEEIREVCARLLTANDSDFEALVQELQRGLRSRFEKISNLAVAATLKMPRSKKAIEDKEETGNREKARYGT